jgi:hypothetical protein
MKKHLLILLMIMSLTSCTTRAAEESAEVSKHPIHDENIAETITDIYDMFISQAKVMGVETLILFTVDGDEARGAQSADIQTKCVKNGLNFIEITRAWDVVQCGSSLAHYMNETLPPLVEGHGKDVVFMGLGEERLLWFAIAEGTFFIPLYDDSQYLIDETRLLAQESGVHGRIASWSAPTDDISAKHYIVY